MTTDDRPPVNPLALVNTHWLHRADQRVRLILDVNKDGGLVMSIPERIEIVETVASVAALEADWERVRWMPGWFTEAEAAKVRGGGVHVIGGGPVDDYRTTFGIVETPADKPARHREADIVINGVTLTHAQSMAVRVAVTSFLIDLPDRLVDLGPIGPLYQARLGEVQDLIVDPLNG